MAKKNLDDAYLEAEVDFINGKINTLSMEHISRKHHLAWKTVKELSGKNSTTNVSLCLSKNMAQVPNNTTAEKGRSFSCCKL